MNGLLKFSVVSASFLPMVLDSRVNAGDCCADGGVSYHGRIVVKYHRTYLGAAPAPISHVVVQQAPPMIGVPLVAMAPYAPSAGYAPYPAFPYAAPLAPQNVTAPTAPPAPASPNAPALQAASQSDLADLRASVKEIRDQMLVLTDEVRKVRATTDDFKAYKAKNPGAP